MKIKFQQTEQPQVTQAAPPDDLQGEMLDEGVGLPREGYVRLKRILAPAGPIPVSPATWWAGVQSGRFPKPTKFFGPGITAWDVEDIRKLIAQAKLQT